jgi:hypothetical protein
LFQDNQTIESLDIRGSLDQYEAFFASGPKAHPAIIPEFPELFKVLRQAKALKKLDVSFQLLDEAACDALGHWAMKSPSLEFLAFDGTRLTTLDAIVRLCDVCYLRDTGLSISYPEHDLMRIAKRSGHDLSLDIRRLKHQLRSIQKPKAKRKPYEPSQMFEPIDVYCARIDDAFTEDLPVDRPARPSLELTPDRQTLSRRSSDRTPVATGRSRRTGTFTDSEVSRHSEVTSPSEVASHSEAASHSQVASQSELSHSGVASHSEVSHSGVASRIELSHSEVTSDSEVLSHLPIRAYSDADSDSEHTGAAPYGSRASSLSESSLADLPIASSTASSRASSVLAKHQPKRRSTAVSPTSPAVRQPPPPVPERPWLMPIQFAPEIDNAEIIEKLEADFSVDQLLEDLRET